MTFSGGSYEEVARWLQNFLTSHAKREDPRVEVALEMDDEGDGQSYRAWLVLNEQTSKVIELDSREVAEQRGNLAWCRALAERARAAARTLIDSTTGASRTR